MLVQKKLKNEIKKQLFSPLNYIGITFSWSFSAASFHSTVIHFLFSPFSPHFYSLSALTSCLISQFLLHLPSFLPSSLPLRSSAECQDRSVEREQDKGQWTPWLIFRSHGLFPSCPPHFRLCSYSFSLSDECFVYFCSYVAGIFVNFFCSCFYSTLLFSCRLN